MDQPAKDWRQKAKELFPHLGNEIMNPDFSLYSLFFDLLPEFREACKQRDELKLRAIFDFAEWCFSQPDKELWNPAGVAFYEHLFDDEKLSVTDILRWLPATVRNRCEQLWKRRLSSERYSEIAALMDKIPATHRCC